MKPRAGNSPSSSPRSSLRYRHGVWAENIACLLLFVKGYTILGRRVRTPVGEIDIIAAKGNTIAIIEVKKRESFARAAGAISVSQQQRLRRAGRFFLVRHRRTSNRVLRFDAVLVNRWGWPHHLANVWSDDES